MNEVVLLLAYFMVYAFIGWVLESAYKSILQKSQYLCGFADFRKP